MKIIWVMFATFQVLQAFASVNFPLPEGACTEKESWKFPDGFNKKFASSFQDGVLESDIIDSITELVPYRNSSNSQIQSMTQYWTARAFYNQKQYTIAFRFFQSLIEGFGKTTSIGPWLASLQCVSMLLDQYPSFQLSPSATQAILGVSFEKVPSSYHEVLAKLWVQLAKRGEADPVTLINQLSRLPQYQAHLKALSFLKEKKYSEAAQSLVVALQKPLWDIDEMYLLQARAYYSASNWNKVIESAQKIRTTSNAMPQALVAMSWAYLNLKDYANALAKSVSLQVGPLRRAFTPEAPMIAGIAFYEICQYPESQKATQLFRHLYGPSYRWLNAWKTKVTQKRPIPYYDLVTQSLQGKEVSVPDPILTEWIRDPHFLAKQAELNMVLEAREGIVHFVKKYIRKGSDGKNPPAIRLIQGTYKSELPKLKKRSTELVHEIDQILTKRTLKTYKELSQVADNVKLLEIDLYNRATEDIIFRTKHPEFAEFAKHAKSRAATRKTATMDWGGVDAHEPNSIEVWDDEIGQLNTDLPNICNEKKKFLKESTLEDVKNQ
jgi:hypothetical protein